MSFSFGKLADIDELYSIPLLQSGMIDPDCHCEELIAKKRVFRENSKSTEERKRNNLKKIEEIVKDQEHLFIQTEGHSHTSAEIGEPQSSVIREELSSTGHHQLSTSELVKVPQPGNSIVSCSSSLQGFNNPSPKDDLSEHSHPNPITDLANRGSSFAALHGVLGSLVVLNNSEANGEIINETSKEEFNNYDENINVAPSGFNCGDQPAGVAGGEILNELSQESFSYDLATNDASGFDDQSDMRSGELQIVGQAGKATIPIPGSSASKLEDDGSGSSTRWAFDLQELECSKPGGPDEKYPLSPNAVVFIRRADYLCLPLLHPTNSQPIGTSINPRKMVTLLIKKLLPENARKNVLKTNIPPQFFEAIKVFINIRLPERCRETDATIAMYIYDVCRLKSRDRKKEAERRKFKIENNIPVQKRTKKSDESANTKKVPILVQGREISIDDLMSNSIPGSSA